jgi:hypothetical protein
LEQLTSESLASDDEIKESYVVYPRVQACRKTDLDRLATVVPTIAPILTDAWGRDEASVIDLVQKKKTWGDYVRHSKEIAADTGKQITVAFQQINASLQQSHQAEMAQRQRAADAMAQYYQNQQLINAINKPVITNCTRAGNMVNCTSY